MGRGSNKNWYLIFAEFEGFSQARIDFLEFGRQRSRAHKHVRFSIEGLQKKALGDLVDPGILVELKNGLWQLQLAGGTFYFLGAVESAPEMRFVAFAGYGGEDAASRAIKVELALESLKSHLSKEYQKYVFYGLAQ